VDGLIVLDPERDDALVQLCDAAGTPVVTVDRQPGRASHWSVGNDHVAPSRTAHHPRPRRPTGRTRSSSGPNA
jgi:DNA-binding LacI/PurR family transcriptional regulator